MNHLKSGFEELPPMPKLTSVPKMPLTTVESEYLPPSMTGGKRRVAKKKPLTKKDSIKSKPVKKGKKGGSLMDDVKNLAVPFAILLAKQGLTQMFAKKGKKSSSDIKASVPARRRTVGGSCGAQCGMTHSGGNEDENQDGGAHKKKKSTRRPKDQDNQDNQDQNRLDQDGGACKKKKSTKSKPKSKHHKGGANEQQIKQRFDKLSKEIDQFLQKY